MMAFGCYAQTLKLSLVKGTKYEVSTKMTVNSNFNVGGQDMENNVDNKTLQTVEVKETRANETDLVSVTTKMVANMDAMGQKMSFDSEKKDNSGPLAVGMGSVIGKIKNTTIDASGKVINEEKGDLADGMGAVLGISANNFSILEEALIGKEMKVGNTWIDSVVNNADKMKSTTVGTYKVTAVNNDSHSATITFTGNETSSGTIEQMGMEMNMSGSNKVETQFEVNLNTAVIIKMTTTSNGSSTIDAQGMSIPVTTVSITTTTIKAL